MVEDVRVGPPCSSIPSRIYSVATEEYDNEYTMSTNKPIVFVVLGEPASKANSRKLVTDFRTKKPRFIKSEKARSYGDTFRAQCPEIRPLVEHDVVVYITIYYASRRPDLDESVILDCMQPQKIKRPDGGVELVGGIYRNDRQVKEKHVFWRLDRENPRTEVRVEPLIDEPVTALPS